MKLDCISSSFLLEVLRFFELDFNFSSRSLGLSQHSQPMNVSSREIFLK